MQGSICLLRLEDGEGEKAAGFVFERRRSVFCCAERRKKMLPLQLLQCSACWLLLLVLAKEGSEKERVRL